MAVCTEAMTAVHVPRSVATLGGDPAGSRVLLGVVGVVGSEGNNSVIPAAVIKIGVLPTLHVRPRAAPALVAVHALVCADE